jgi:hypothetical protein
MGNERKGISIEGIVAARDNQPYVILFVNEQRTQLTIAEAQKIAADLVQMASRTEADAMLVKFFIEQKLPQALLIQLLKDFRDFRFALDTEPVEGFICEPTGGQGVQ